MRMTNELRVIMIMMGLVQDMMMVIVWLLGRWEGGVEMTQTWWRYYVLYREQEIHR